MISIDHLSVEFSAKPLFSDISYVINDHDRIALVGKNGAGKSTTLKSILNLVHMNEGHVEFFGLDLKKHESKIKQLIGYTGGAVNFYKKKKINTFMINNFYRQDFFASSIAYVLPKPKELQLSPRCREEISLPP